MSIASVLTAAGKIVEFVASVLPKRSPAKPKFEPIKITPKRPLDPYEAKDKP